jgi:hypothetical protein
MFEMQDVYMIRNSTMIGAIKMPLITTGKPGVPDNGQMAIGFWMTVEVAHPVEPIRIFVTYKGLEQIDPSQVPDIYGAREIFTRNRALIEAAASKKFDKDGVDDGEHEGRRPQQSHNTPIWNPPRHPCRPPSRIDGESKYRLI